MLDIACAASAVYAPHCAAMLHSLLSQHPGGDCRIHYLHDPALSADVMQRMRSLVEAFDTSIHFYRVDTEALAHLPVRWHISLETWYRVLLPEMLPHLERVLYLDADTLVVDRLDALSSLELGDAYVAAVNNVPMDGVGGPQPHTARGFNGGVMLLNLERLRVDDCAARALELARTRRLPLLDQDAMNEVLASGRMTLHPRWNCQNSLFYFPWSARWFEPGQRDEAIRKPAILHFEGPGLAKPWHYLSRHPYRGSYRQHRLATPWPELELEGRTPAARFLRLLPTRWTIALMETERRARRGLRRVLPRRG